MGCLSLSRPFILCHDADMEESAEYRQAEANLKEAERQLKHAQEEYDSGGIDDERLEELKRLRQIAVDDVQRLSGQWY